MARHSDHSASPDWDAIDRTLAGQATADDMERMRCLFGDAANVAVPLVREELAQWKERDIELLLGRFREHLETTDPAFRSQAGKPGSAGRSGRAYTRWLGAAAAFVAICAIGVTMKIHAKPDREAIKPETSYATAQGQRATVTLKDGSRVRLAPGTTLRVADGFGRTSRTITVDGEAHVDVPSASGIPFIVRSGTSVARVLGTEFTVRRYVDEAVTGITVASGRVSLASGDGAHSTVVSRGGAAIATDSAVKGIAADEMESRTDWGTGRLVFRRAPLTEVLTAMTRWYGYTFRLSDSTLGAKRVTLWVSTESSNEALASLKLTMGVDMTIDGNVVSIRPSQGVRERAPVRRESTELTTFRTEVGR